ncbi:DoxX family membrane protein [Bacillus luteolus]|uniref:DoxX family membrane protein n=1 Tax=Litchfieldia luteola TaxID=682179 RepID=A0ABR9QFJ4_9BACI|nr:DoxX family membrane protein [Cytobacillus luteolus]MBE4907260.1 DoxX family membrane protein [Cytobacillus luteolus]MBP1943262.1 thiosulfate dehydrogenase [quinone] large subunit [Cytobacillus luteolus]
MINNFLRENRIVAGALALIRIFLGWSWMTAGWGKITGGFDAGGYLGNAVANPVLDKGTGEAIYPMYNAFIEGFALPNVGLINFLIPWGEFLVGLGLLLGCLTTAAAFFGLMMNFMFMFAGTVSTNPEMILLGVIVLAAGANAGRYGADYFVLPYLRKVANFKINKNDKTGTTTGTVEEKLA